ncbi:glutathione synthase [Myxosarcina sp. GI1]|uniref:glutathione synthase n=1 Tax=Myxosarcina sp. GI1 TaxID=1541065 RepID=UPI00056B2469|nr:glutathione synthase [Myxosarcina sp. GI1]
MKLAFIIDPITQLNPGHDTSVAIMEAAQVLGHQVWTTEASQLTVVEGKAWSYLQAVQLKPVELIEGRWQVPRDWCRVENSVFTCLEEMDAVFMRTDPPVTIPYLYATYILDLIDTKKTLVINSPEGLRTANEKMYALQFTSVIPQTIVTQNKAVIQKFLEVREGGVLKPLGGKAGEGILFLEKGDRNFNSLIEVSTQRGREPVMIQEYLPAAKEGDKRIVLLDGDPIGAVNRIPTGSEFRGNMAVGGKAAKVDITERDLEICATVAPQLQADGLYFVGIDIIGGYLTEVNVTSPTGIREIDRFNNVRLGEKVIKWLENKLNFFK